jgi:hypothetical protein
MNLLKLFSVANDGQAPEKERHFKTEGATYMRSREDTEGSQYLLNE